MKTPIPASLPIETSTRRKFITRVSQAAAASIAVSATGLASVAKAASQQSSASPTPAFSNGNNGHLRALQSFNNRRIAAQTELNVPIPQEITNGDEQRYSNRIGNYSKGLAHNGVGEVDPASFRSFLQPIQSGEPQQFEQIQLGGNALLVDPQAGLAF